jgi:hypothetical protein
MPLESLPPFIIITAAITAMGAIQGGIHKLYAGKPKAVGVDSWDRLLAVRDARIEQEGKGKAKARLRCVRKEEPV